MDLVLDNGTVVGFLCTLQFNDQYGLSLRVIDADPSFALGELELKKREIIERLQKEGLFEPNKQRFVPMLPLRIGLITSSGSAAYNDFIQTLTVSGFGFKVYFADAMMQGDQTERSVIRALERLSSLNLELIVIARGGGSKTDLYYLDNEVIARKIADYQVPVWSGIGHEIDTSVLDYVANKAFKTPTAVAEELVARLVQMRRQLDEATSTLKTVWSYNARTNAENLERAATGIRQGTRKLLDVTASELREQMNQLHIRVMRRITTEQINLVGRREKLLTKPTAAIQSSVERLSSKRQNVVAFTRMRLAAASATLAGQSARFDQDRFLRRVAAERENNARSLMQLKSRFSAIVEYRQMHLRHVKDRFKAEKVLQRIGYETKTLENKLAILKASDPQNVLRRGFAIAHRKDGTLIRSINDVSEHERIYTHFADGMVTSEVVAKESKHE